MFSAFKEIDRVLRGEATSVAALRHGTIPVRLRRITPVIIFLGMFYGLCMGCFAVFRYQELSPEDVYCLSLGEFELCFPRQMVATTVKVPLLFFLTLLVTFPSLYVFNALVGSRLTLKPVMTLLIASLGVNLAVLASFGTIVAFFTICTTSYPFMVLLNVVVFGLAGVLGLSFLLQTLHRISVSQQPPPSVETFAYAEQVTEGTAPEETSEAPSEPGALDALEGHVLGPRVRNIFRVWVCIFGLVGAQMGWVLRPFVGDPHLPFSWFRERQSNFFVSIFDSIQQLLGS